MTRLQDAGGSEIERRLLASATDDAMPDEKYRALLQWSEGAALAARAAPLRASWKVPALKGLGLFALVAAVGAVADSSSSSSTVTAPEASSAAPRAPATTATTAPLDERAAAPSVVVPDVPVLTPNQLPSAPIAVAAPSARAPKTDDVSLGEQMKFIDSARTRLRQDDARGALSVLDDYARRYSEPAFREEATVLRVSAHAKAGEIAEAKRLGGAFLSTHPAELYSRRVEAILRSLEPQEGAR